MGVPRPSVDREPVGIVRLGGDGERVEVVVVRRSWTTTRVSGAPSVVADRGGATTVRTTALAGIEIRRVPPTTVDEPGGMSAAARRLAKLLGVAAERAAVLDRAAREARR